MLNWKNCLPARSVKILKRNLLRNVNSTHFCCFACIDIDVNLSLVVHSRSPRAGSSPISSPQHQLWLKSETGLKMLKHYQNEILFSSRPSLYQQYNLMNLESLRVSNQIAYFILQIAFCIVRF